MSKVNNAQSNDQAEINQDLYAELRGESERAAAIFGAAILDHFLRSVLDAFIASGHPDASSPSTARGSYGNFSSRIKDAFRMKLITSEEKTDLDLIRRIRNPFAHQIISPSFEEGEIRDLSLELSIGKKFLGHAQRDSPRDCFEATTSALAYSLAIREIQAKRNPPFRAGIVD